MAAIAATTITAAAVAITAVAVIAAAKVYNGASSEAPFLHL